LPSDAARILCDGELMIEPPDVEKPAAEPDDAVYKLPIPVVPADGGPPIDFANSSYKPVVKQWGEVVGTLADAAVEPAGGQPEPAAGGSEAP
jgi:hypothetical protein